MSIEPKQPLLASDIDAIITSINNEISRRGTTGTLTPVVKGQFPVATLPTAMKTALGNINAVHNYPPATFHNGGVTLTLSSSNSTFTVGSSMNSNIIPSMVSIMNDIAPLSQQIQCANACNANNGCSPQCNNCSCNANCGCNSQCCNAQSTYGCFANCTCNSVCSNNACGAQCGANGCSCNPNCVNNTCTCEYV